MTIDSNIDEHLDVDLPLLLATCSKYNILLKPAKCDLVCPETRILGHQISEESMTLSNEKVEKIESLTFPVDKKEAISKLAFFQYFARIAPRLSELLGPLRDLTAQHKKFIPTEEHRRGFEEAKKHLLDEKVNCIRTPSSDPSDTLVLWTDASVNSISCLLTQCLEPLTDEFPKKKHLYIIGCFSSVIKPAWRNWPIWLLELISFYEATRKFRTILIGRPFYVITDSRVVDFS